MNAKKIANFFEYFSLSVFGLFGGLIFDWSRGGLFLHVVHGTDNEENNESDDEKINDGLNEIAVVDGGRFFEAGKGRDDELEVGEIETADNHGDNGHDDIVN